MDAPFFTVAACSSLPVNARPLQATSVNSANKLTRANDSFTLRGITLLIRGNTNRDLPSQIPTSIHSLEADIKPDLGPNHADSSVHSSRTASTLKPAFA